MNLLRSGMAGVALLTLGLFLTWDAQPLGVPRYIPATVSADDDTAGDSRVTVRPIIAVARMPAPSTDPNIRITLTNLSGQSPEGPQNIQAAIVDCHRALGRRALTVDRVMIDTPPPGGGATVTTGNDPDDVGPAVITFSDFGFTESADFTPDLDTWEDPGFVETRGDLAGCRVEVVFLSGRLKVALLRGDGTMRVRADDSVEATIRQQSP